MHADETPDGAPRAEDAGSQEPGTGRRRRRRGRGRAEGAERPAEPSSAPEAAAFADPPPLGAAGDAAAEDGRGSGRPRRGRRRRGRARRKGEEGRPAAAPTPGGEGAGTTGTVPQGASDGGGESEGGDEGGRERKAGEGERRPRRARRGGRRRRARSESPSEGAAGLEAEAEVDVPPLPSAKAEVRASESARSPAKEKRRKARKGEGGERHKERRQRGRKDGGRRTSPGRREGRSRDPRAIDIVPVAPDASEAAKEKILLVNAADREEARIALLVDGRLEEVYVETGSSERSSAGNVYRGRVQNVEPGIGAAFVDLGRGLTGFLHVTDLPQPEAGEGDDEEPDDIEEEDEKKEEQRDQAKGVADRLHPGDEVIVQITRDSIGRKGPALTGRISFPGRYLVLMPFTARSGISRRIPQGAERERVRRLLRELEVPEGMGVIVRTASETTDLAALEADLGHLLKEWEFIKRKAAEPGQPGLLRGESDLAERSVRDIMPGDVRRIVVDREEIAGQIHRLLRVWYPSAAAAADEAAHAAVRTATAALDTPIGELRAQAQAPPPLLPAAAPTDGPPPAPPAPEGEGSRPEAVAAAAGEGETESPPERAEAPTEAAEDRPADAPPEESAEERLARLAQVARAMPEVELHTDPLPLFHRFGVESQIEDAFRRTIRLPAGGSIVIDPTEALVSVDVNSGRLTGEADPESTALVTNLEAVVEAARQLRLRDLGGLVVIDFIDMRDRASRRKVERALQDALSHDRARIRMGHMGPFGLVVLSRQRIRQALTRVTHEACSACAGTGRRRLVSGLGLRVLREMEARIARSRGRGGLEVRAPQEVVAWIKRQRPMVLRRLAKACTGPVQIEADDRLASDGWAMKGLPPSTGGPAPDAEPDPEA